MPAAGNREEERYHGSELLPFHCLLYPLGRVAFWVEARWSTRFFHRTSAIATLHAESNDVSVDPL